MMHNRGEINNRWDSVSKPILLGLTTAIITAVIAPAVVPHLSHPTMIYHIIVHIAGMIVAAFLALVSCLAYKRVRGTRIFLMTLSFMALGAAEILHFFDATDIFQSIHLPISNIEVSHIMLLIMLVLFGLGVLNRTSTATVERRS